MAEHCLQLKHRASGKRSLNHKRKTVEVMVQASQEDDSAELRMEDEVKPNSGRWAVQGSILLASTLRKYLMVASQ